ncbi:(2,3-dihydroxybenzoyl)adenylate synthase [Pseudolysinimonas yzui]|uniref:2,3-dihydroxybenzoate-AMP ligase n=1 Tax=Pseudolysinimonas yzui TaxID=2708254 RepID=A0A8J3M2Y1_9MICO|nr:AMP-binding protein [Pseudolysinimonas yzui]GHF27395.1 2,3-dihydroxybenzoate-AMP ligase [Pseudolysinimonas yzui]
MSLPGTVPWPPEFASRYRSEGYWEDRPIGDYIADAAAAAPERVAVVTPEVRMTYDELMSRADAAAARLHGMGLRPGDRILLQLPNDWPFIVLTLACFRSGVIPVMALPAHRLHELSHLARMAEARAIAVPDRVRDFDHVELARQVAAEAVSVETILVSGAAPDDCVSLADLLAPAAADHNQLDHAPDPDSPACFLLSGGTTGLPKLIVRTHNDYAYNVRATASATGFSERTVYLSTLPASHNFALACPGILGALFVGGTAVMLPSPEPARAFETIRREGVTVASAVPAVAQRWLEHQRESGAGPMPSFEVLQVGGSRMPDELAARVRPELGATLQQVFGMAEGLINMTRLDDPDDVILTTQGRPVSPADEIRILDDQGGELPDDAVGSIVTRGPYTPRGYFQAKEQNARAFLDGWYASGDLVQRRPDGNLVVHGRDKDTINRGGEKISAEEVESFAYRIDGIRLAAVVGTPDPILGERICLCVVLRTEVTVTLDDVRASFARAGLAPFKHPEQLELLDEMPLTKVGKVDKAALRTRFANERLKSPPA